MFGRIDPVEINEWKKIIGTFKPSSALIVHSAFHTEIAESQIDYNMPFGEEIKRRIENGSVIVAIDASVKDEEIGR